MTDKKVFLDPRLAKGVRRVADAFSAATLEGMAGTVLREVTPWLE